MWVDVDGAGRVLVLGYFDFDLIKNRSLLRFFCLTPS